MASIPLPPPIDDDALQALDIVIARAFGIEGGYLELNGIVSAANAAGYDMFVELGLWQSPMELIVPALRRAIQAEGGDKDRACLTALFVALPGNVELREWIARYCPAMLALISGHSFEAARPAYEQGRMDRRVGAIKDGLARLASGIQLSPEQKAVARQMIRKLSDLKGYKDIHDILHDLQGRVLLELGLIADSAILGSDRRARLSEQEQLLRLATERIAQQFLDPDAPEPAQSARDALIGEIGDMIALLPNLDPEARETAEAIGGLLRAILRQRMGPFDTKVVETVDEIPFGDFADALRTMTPANASPDTAASRDPVLAANVGAGLDDIKARLVRRRAAHTLWQRVDATLFNVEDLLRGAGREIELKIHVGNLSRLIEQIAALSADHGLFALPMPVAADGTMDAFVVAVRSDDYQRKFASFAREARTRFRRADNALLNDCRKLEQLQQPLRVLVGD